MRPVRPARNQSLRQDDTASSAQITKRQWKMTRSGGGGSDRASAEIAVEVLESRDIIGSDVDATTQAAEPLGERSLLMLFGQVRRITAADFWQSPLLNARLLRVGSFDAECDGLNKFPGRRSLHGSDLRLRAATVRTLIARNRLGPRTTGIPATALPNRREATRNRICSLVPSGHTHSTWGKEAKVVVDCVNHTTIRKASFRRCLRMLSAYHGSSTEQLLRIGRERSPELPTTICCLLSGALNSRGGHRGTNPV